MGVDITFFAEERLPDGTWSIAGDLVPNLDYYPDDPDFAGEPEFVPPALDINRCSPLFSVLANVNNTRTATPFEFISLPRGIPVDASAVTRKWFAAWEGDAFAASWLTLDEIDSFDWNRVKQHYGCVDAGVAHLFENNPMGFPFSEWPKNLQVSYSDAKEDAGNVSWRATYAESAGFKWFRGLLAPFESIEMVRFVFWFSH